RRRAVAERTAERSRRRVARPERRHLHRPRRAVPLRRLPAGPVRLAVGGREADDQTLPGVLGHRSALGLPRLRRAWLLPPGPGAGPSAGLELGAIRPVNWTLRLPCPRGAAAPVAS